MITLSFTSISGLHEHPHYWLNKMMGAKMPEWDFFKRGKECHRIMQDHVSGRVPNKGLEWFQYKFPLVEEVDYDPKMNFRIKINEKYEVQGFLDGLNEEELSMLEGKFGEIWSLGKYQRSFQRKIYSLLRPDIKVQRILTGVSFPEQWPFKQPKTYTIEPTQADRDEAMAYILEGIRILESGEFYGDLVKSDDGEYHCNDPRCLYGKNCLFK